MTPLPQSPFLPEPVFVLDTDRFLSDIGVEPMPVFISDPSEEFMSAVDLAPIAEVLRRFL